MTHDPLALDYYNDEGNARRYHSQTGFDPMRKREMLKVTLSALQDLLPAGGHLLEIGCGSGLFTQELVSSRHFGSLCATDGANAMLGIARSQLAGSSVSLMFKVLDFTEVEWPVSCQSASFDAVTSSMALHHAADKRQVFSQVFKALAPGGVFVFADQMAGSSLSVDRLIDRERGRVKLGEEANETDLEIFAEADRQRQEKQGNHCESVADYLGYLEAAGFVGIDCLWRDYWLAVFVAQRPTDRMIA